MAELTHGPVERYLFVTGHLGQPNRDEELTLDVATTLARGGVCLSLYVTGWSAPWRCFWDGEYLRAICPTAPKVQPRIVLAAFPAVGDTGRCPYCGHVKGDAACQRSHP